MASNTLLTTYHIRGMTDSGGSPNTEISTVKVEHWGDGTIRCDVINAVAARGWVRFAANPSNGQTIALNGSTWTFVTAGATGNQTNIGASLAATLTQLVTDLNASADGNLTGATYSASNSVQLNVVYDTTGTGGNAYTLGVGTAASAVSSATLTGGDAGSHYRFHLSGSTGLARLVTQILGLTGVIGQE